jgi:hypothetical protein
MLQLHRQRHLRRRTRLLRQMHPRLPVRRHHPVARRDRRRRPVVRPVRHRRQEARRVHRRHLVEVHRHRRERLRLRGLRQLFQPWPEFPKSLSSSQARS